MIKDKKTIELVKIMELVKNWDPQTWRREYPPKISYKDSKISSEVVRAHLRKVFYDKKQKIGAYFHIPFCKSRCGFCEFYSAIPHGKAIDDYLNLLEKELMSYGVNFKKNSLDNLYLGGGTPSLLSEKQILNFFKTVHRYFETDNQTIIMTEGTPDSSSLTKLKLFKEFGVSRYTVGAQCFDERVLKLSRRLYGVKDIYKAFLNARRAGIKYINLDILLGLHGETEKTYRATLQGILDLKPDCVSFMIFDQGFGVNSDYAKKANKSYFWKKSLRPNIFTYLDFVMKSADYINAKGFVGSTFVLRGKEEAANRNIFNRNCLNPIVGFGVAAESSLPNLKFINAGSLKEYYEDIINKKQIEHSGVELSEDEAIRRYVIYQYLFFGKINKKDFKIRFKKNFTDIFWQKFPVFFNQKQYIDSTEDIVFLPDKIFKTGYLNTIVRSRNYNSQEYLFLICLKYFYSQETINKLKKLVS